MMEKEQINGIPDMLMKTNKKYEIFEVGIERCKRSYRTNRGKRLLEGIHNKEIVIKETLNHESLPNIPTDLYGDREAREKIASIIADCSR